MIWIWLIIAWSAMILLVLRLLQFDKPPTTFADIDVGQRFFDGGGTPWRKLGPAVIRKAGENANVIGESKPLLDNAVCLGPRRFTMKFKDDDIVQLPEPMPPPSFWRRFLLHRALVWQTYGHPRKAKLCWRIARLLATETVEQRCAAYCSQLLMVGD